VDQKFTPPEQPQLINSHQKCATVFVDSLKQHMLHKIIHSVLQYGELFISGVISY